MWRSISAVVLLLLLFVLCGVALDCSRHCYSGALSFTDDPPTVAEFSFGVVPCSQTVDGHIDQTPLTAFSCDVSGGLLHVTIQSAADELPFYQLQWLYNTSATCAETLAGGLEFTGDEFVGATHTLLHIGDDVEPVSVSASSGALSSLESACGQDCGMRCYSVRMLADYAPGVGEGSPCGVAGSQQCDVTLAFTVQPCTGYLSSLEVLVGPEGTPLSLYDPQQLANARFICMEDGQLQLDAAGLYVLWAPTAQPCSTLLDALNTNAIGGVSQLAVVVGHETWSNEVEQGAQTSLSLSVCQSVSTNNGTDDEVNALSAVPVRKRILPFVTCSHQIELDQCCTVFGYLNPNFESVCMPRRKGSNWFTPSPVNRGQTLVFAGNSTVLEAFAVIWPCNKYERHVLTWSLKHPRIGHDLERTWFRQSRAVRTRNDCNAGQREQWCSSEES